jgi:hypothetical protein
VTGATDADTPPSIGIFWVLSVPGRSPQVLADLVALDQGEPYGEFLTHGGHYEHWESLARSGAAQLRRRGLPTAPAWSEYEEWPRGRVVFHVPTRQFVVYADRKLWPRPVLGPIVARFGLRGCGFDLRGDPHYISVRPLAGATAPPEAGDHD